MLSSHLFGAFSGGGIVGDELFDRTGTEADRDDDAPALRGNASIHVHRFHSNLIGTASGENYGSDAFW